MLFRREALPQMMDTALITQPAIAVQAVAQHRDSAHLPPRGQANKVGSAIEEAALDESEWPSLSKSKETAMGV